MKILEEAVDLEQSFFACNGMTHSQKDLVFCKLIDLNKQKITYRSFYNMLDAALIIFSEILFLSFKSTDLFVDIADAKLEMIEISYFTFLFV